MLQSFLENMSIIRDGTHNLSFPFFANDMKKRKTIEMTKQEIDSEVIALIGDNQDQLSFFKKENNSLWAEAEKKSRLQFETLPSGLKINSFYLQELAHNYVQLLMDSIPNLGVVYGYYYIN